MSKWIIMACFGFLSGMLVLISCTDHKNAVAAAELKPKPDSGPATLKKPGSSNADTLVIRESAAIFYNPDAIQLEKIKTINQERVYKSLVHECFYQMRNARIVLKEFWSRIKIIETSGARYLQFVKRDNTTRVIDLDTKNDIGGIFLFNREKDPLMIDMMNIDTELNFYFSRQYRNP